MPSKKLMWLPGPEAILKWANDKSLVEKYFATNVKIDELRSLETEASLQGDDKFEEMSRATGIDAESLKRSLRKKELDPRICERLRGTKKSPSEVSKEFGDEAQKLAAEASDIWRELLRQFTGRLQNGEIIASGHFEPVGRGRVQIAPEDWGFLELWRNGAAAEPTDRSRLLRRQSDAPVSVCWLMFGGPRDRGRPGPSPFVRSEILKWVVKARAENPGLSRKQAYERAKKELRPVPSRDAFNEIFDGCRGADAASDASQLK